MLNFKLLRIKIRRKFFVFLCAILIITVAGVVFVDTSLKPTMNAVAEVRVRYYAVDIMNRAIKQVTASNDNIKSVVEVLTNADGSVKLVQTDSVEMNRLSTLVSQTAQDMLQELTEINISIPLGSIVSNGIFSGKGPNIIVNMVPAGAVNTSFSTEFENAGINQTRHRVYLEVTAQVRMVAPLSGGAIEVKTVVPITEMIIVGDVPDTYINVDSLDDAMNLVP